MEMSRIGKSMGVECRLVAAILKAIGGLGATGCKVSFWSDKNVLLFELELSLDKQAILMPPVKVPETTQQKTHSFTGSVVFSQLVSEKFLVLP